MLMSELFLIRNYGKGSKSNINFKKCDLKYSIQATKHLYFGIYRWR